MLTFLLVRDEDVSGVSGTGVVASGCIFRDGVTVVRWHTKTASTAVYRSLADAQAIHGHNGRTRFEFLDAAMEREGWITHAQDIFEGVPLASVKGDPANGPIGFRHEWSPEKVRAWTEGYVSAANRVDAPAIVELEP